MKPTEITTIRDLKLTRLGLGTAPLGGLYSPVSQEAATNTIGRAYELGLSFFDTAPLYGYGTAESRLGAALADKPRDSYVLATKVGRLLRDTSDRSHNYDVDQTQFHAGEPFYKSTGPDVPIFDFSYDGAMRSLEESLGRLGVDSVDIVHIHDPDNHMDEAISGAVRALADLREQRVIGAIGVAIDHSHLGMRFIREADIDCLLIAGRCTLLDQEALPELFPLALANGVGIIAAGVFNSGVLANLDNNPTFNYVPSPPRILERAFLIRDICRDFNVPLKAAAIQYPYQHAAVTTVIVGARTPQEIEENVKLASVNIPDELWAALEANAPSL
jgi:D-threo-aldose 1-dehydrogenase